MEGYKVGCYFKEEGMMTYRQEGFTLIELVIVIVLIGILAATALPKFVNLTSQARTAAIQGFSGGLGAAVNIVHAGWLAGGQTTPVTIEGGTVAVNNSGWPDNGKGGAASALSAAQCAGVVTDVMNNPPTVTSGTCTAGNSNCYVATQATGAVGVCTGITSTCVYTQTGSTNAVNYDPVSGKVCGP